MELLTNWLAECWLFCLGVDRLIHWLEDLELTVWLWSWVKPFEKSNMATLKNHNLNIWINSSTTCTFRWQSEIISRPILSTKFLIFAQNMGLTSWKKYQMHNNYFVNRTACFLSRQSSILQGPFCPKQTKRKFAIFWPKMAFKESTMVTV